MGSIGRPLGSLIPKRAPRGAQFTGPQPSQESAEQSLIGHRLQHQRPSEEDPEDLEGGTGPVCMNHGDQGSPSPFVPSTGKNKLFP